MRELEQLISSGSFDELLDVTANWDDKQKREAQKWLTARWKEGNYSGLFSYTYREDKGSSWMRLVVANVATAKDIKQALYIPPPGDDLAYLSREVDPEPKAALIKAVARRGREWTADYVAMAASGKPKDKPVYVDVLMALTSAYDLPTPQDPFFIDAWSKSFYMLRYETARIPVPYKRIVPRARVMHGANGAIEVEVTGIVALSPLDATRAVGGLPVVIASLFARKDAILNLLRGYPLAKELEEMPPLIAGLIATGELNREATFEQAITALMRGDAVTAQRFQAALLVACDPQLADISRHSAALLSLLASGHGSAAVAAQGLLRWLEEHEALDGEVFCEACQMVFSRKEKGLRDEQFNWALRRLAHHPSQAKANLGGLIAGLVVDDFAFQKRVVQKIQEHWQVLDASCRAELLPQVTACESAMDAKLYAALAAAIGIDAPAATPMPRAENPAPIAIAESMPLIRFTSSPSGIAGLRETLAEYISGSTYSTGEPIFAGEQLIEAALVLNQADKEGLKSALSEFIAQHPDWRNGLPHVLYDAICQSPRTAERMKKDIDLLARHAVRREDMPQARAGRPAWQSAARDEGVAEAIMSLRLSEIARSLQISTPYPLLSRPGYRNGGIAASDLIERLVDLSKGSARVGPLDLLLALMRTQQPDHAGIAALRAIGSPEAIVAADFFAAGGMGQMTTSWAVMQPDPSIKRTYFQAEWLTGEHPEVCVTLHGMKTLPAIAGIPVRWADDMTPMESPALFWWGLSEISMLGPLPNNGEIVAALHLWGFRRAAGGVDRTHGAKQTALALPVIVAARGPAGPATHLAIFYVLSADDATARIVGSDCLLELIAQQRYDSDLAVELIAALIPCGILKLGRLASSLAQVVEAGAAQQLWPMVRSSIVAALTLTPAPTGLHELLALASQMAITLGLKENIAPLAHTAEKSGSNKMLIEARRLHELLVG